MQCVSHIVQVLHRFGIFSGYRTNLTKSECFPVNNLALGIPQKDLPFHLSKYGFRNLGINITHNFPKLYKDNLTHLIDKLKKRFTELEVH